jgi:hypothetical protein
VSRPVIADGEPRRPPLRPKIVTRSCVVVLAVLANVAFAGRPLRARPNAAALLTERVVRDVSGFAGGFRHEALAPADAAYSDVHLRAIGQPESFDVALRVWARGRDTYDRLHRDLPDTVDVSPIGARTFIAEDDDIYGVVFEDDRGFVAMLTCGKYQCRTVGDAIALANRIRAAVPSSW